jgi:hypothetical protein
MQRKHHHCPSDLLPGQVRSKSNGSSVAAARDDMEESDLMVVSVIENPVVLKREAGEIGRVVRICLADAGEARDQSANRHEVGDEFIACIFTKLFVDVGGGPCARHSIPARRNGAALATSWRLRPRPRGRAGSGDRSRTIGHKARAAGRTLAGHGPPARVTNAGIGSGREKGGSSTSSWPLAGRDHQ